MKIKPVLFAVLLIAVIGLSGCIEQPMQSNAPTPYGVAAPEIKVRVFIEERTGDSFRAGWETKPIGWYTKFGGDSGKNVTSYVDAMTYPNDVRDVDLVLVTDDRTPTLIIKYSGGRSVVTPDITIMRSVPRGTPEGGRRVYDVKMSYNLNNIKDSSVIAITNDYFGMGAVKSFYIYFNSKGTYGYY